MSDDIIVEDDVQVISGDYEFNPTLHYYRSLSDEDFQNLSREEIIILTILDFEQKLQNVVVSEAIKIDGLESCPLLGIMDTHMILIDDISTPISITYLKICLDKSKDFYDQKEFYEAFKILENPYTRDFIRKMRLAK
jgi:hypothetical protein